MLTVFREMAHSVARQLAHLEADRQRLGRDVSDAEQDAVLAEVLERAIADGERAVGADARAARGAARVRRRRRRRLRPRADPRRRRRRPARRRRRAAGGRPPRARRALSRPHHEDSRYRYCTNFIVSGSGLAGARVRAAARGARRLGPRRRRRGDAQGPRPHRRARGGGGALRGRRRGHQPRRRRHARADRRAQRAAGSAGARPGVVAVAAGRGDGAALRRARRPRRRRRRDAQPLDLRAAGRDPRASPPRRCWCCPAPPT